MTMDLQRVRLTMDHLYFLTGQNEKKVKQISHI